MNGEIISGDLKALGQLQLGAAIIGAKIDIENTSALIAMKMAMLVHIGAITHGRAVEVDLFHQVALDQEIQTIIDRGHGNIRHALFRPHKHLLGSGMVSLLQEHTIDMLSLRGQS